MIEARAAQLAPAVQPYAGQQDGDRVALALADMFGGFNSMRQSDDEAVARIDSVMRVLAPFPAWAIEGACRRIQSDGFMRDGKMVKSWPPNDSEVVQEVRLSLAGYATMHRSAVAMLSAPVEEVR